MKVKQLIKILSKLDPNAEVIMSSDSEGNYYSKFDSPYNIYFSNGLKYLEDDGEVYIMTEEDVIEGEVSKNDYKKGKPCIVLYPN